MARAWFGGTSDDWMMGTVAAFGATLVTLNALPLTGTCWDSETGGNQITDLLDANGAAITVLTVTGSKQPRFQGPDGVVEIWVDFGAGRTLLQARDQAAAAAAARDEAQQYAIAAAASVVVDNGDGTASISSPLVSVGADGVAHFVAPSPVMFHPAGTRVGNRVALLGASITANNGNSTLVPNPVGGASARGWSTVGITTWANALLGQALDVAINVSHGGYTSAQILGVTPDALAVGPDWVIGHDWWINDIVTGVPLADSQATIAAIIQACNRAGATVVLTDYLPITVYTTTAMVAQHFAMLDWLHTQQGPGFVLVPVCDAIVDITTGHPLGWVTVDGTHPGPKGARAIGAVLADRLRNLLAGPGARRPVATSVYAGSGVAGSPYELVGNPMMSGPLGAGVANLYTLSGTGSPTGSKVAATDFPNLQWQRITLGADGTAILTPAIMTGAGLTYGDLTLVPGTTKTSFRFEFRIPSVSAAGKWADVTGYAYYTPASETDYALQDTSNVGQDQGFTPDDTTIYTVQSPPAVIPAGSTAIAAGIVLYGQAGAVVDIRRVSLAVVS